MLKGCKIVLVALVFLCCGVLSLKAQEKKVIQFSGLVVTGDSLEAVPYSSIFILNKSLGTITDQYGYFSFAAQVGDSIRFTSVGFKAIDYIIPDSLSGEKYSVIQVLNSDTLLLNETVIYPWPTREQFKQAFLNLDIPDDEIARAQKNLNPDEMYQRMQNMPAAGSETFKNTMSQYNYKLYYANQAPPMQILNPFAWAKFIEAWKNGDFKSKRKDTD